MFELQTFGSVDLVNPAGQSVRSVLAQPRRTALLLYLAAASPRGFHRRDTLLALLWPESDTEHGRAALSQAIYFLRRSLSGPVVISRGNEEIGVDPAHLACDVARFEEAMRAGRKEEALALYRGDFLEGFNIPEAPQFERWMDRERGRLRGQAVEAAWRLVEEAESRGDLPEALRWARHARTLAPAEESALRRLLALLARTGDRSEAVREYEAFAARLRAELDLEPLAETRALMQELRSGDASSFPPSGPFERRMPAPDFTIDEAQEESVPAASIAASPLAVPVDPGGPPHLARRPRHRLRWMAVGAVATVLFASALSLVPSAERTTLEENRVLVASLENRTGDASLDMLGDMAADWITQGLQETGLVQVIDPISTLVASRAVAGDFAHLQGIERIAALAERSGAGVVIWGAIYRQGDSLHFHMQMINARDRTVLRIMEPVTTPTGEPIRGVERLRTRVAGTLASMLDRRVASLSTTQGRAPTFEAYQEYILGLELFQKLRNKEALAHFQAAAAHDTTFVLPLFWAAFVHEDRVRRDSLVRTIVPRRERLAPLDQYALDYFLADAREDVSGAFDAVRRAAEISPGSNWSFLAGRYAMLMNRPEEALRYLRRVDPEHGWVKGWKFYWQNLSTPLHQLGRHEEELEAAHRARRVDPEGLMPRGMEVKALVALGRPTDALARANEAMLLPPGFICPGDLLRALAVELRAHGFQKEAKEAFEAAIAWYRSPAAEAWINAHSDPGAARRSARRLLAMNLEGAERWTELEAEYIGMLQKDSTDYVATAGLGRLAARRGDRAAAERSIRALRGMRFSLIARARIAILLGDSRRALDLLRQAFTQGQLEPEVMHHGVPEFDSLRGLPEFQALVRPRG